MNDKLKQIATAAIRLVRHKREHNRLAMLNARDPDFVYRVIPQWDRVVKADKKLCDLVAELAEGKGR